VGTGAGGAVVAKELAQRGHAVVLLEEGAHRGRADFDGRSISGLQRFYRGKSLLGTVGNVFIPLPMGRLVGGSTAINTATCWRTPERVLARWVSAFGLAELAPERMAPYFERVERTLEIAPPDARYLGGAARVIARGADRLGCAHGPVARNAPACDGAGVCDTGCPTGAKRSMDRTCRPRSGTARC
jgi:choline dehydrogenase-like flavoprotein